MNVTETQTAEVIRALATLAKNTDDSKYKNPTIEHKGSKIVLPEDMSKPGARAWIKKAEDAESAKVRVRHQIDCHPLDGARAFKMAMDHLYGFTDLVSKDGNFFEPTVRPTFANVETGPNTSEQVAWGMMRPLNFDDSSYLETYLDTREGSRPMFIIMGEVRRIEEPVVTEIANLTRKILKEQSIYRGKAIRLSFEYQRNGQDYDVERDAPKFIDLSHVKEENLILNRSTEATLRSQVFLRMQRPEAVKANGRKLNHKMLLSGPPGGGKTMTALTTAKVAVDNGWSFLYLEDVRDLTQALRFAESYAPAVIFVEDIDRAALKEKGRTLDLNNLLNTVDGIDTKESPIMTVFTTNDPQNIHETFVRAGRIDTLIELTAPDADAAERFIRSFSTDSNGKSLLAEGSDLTEVGKAIEGMQPAFIHEIVNKATMIALYDSKDDSVVGKVTTQHLLDAAENMQTHYRWVAKGEAPDYRPESQRTQTAIAN